MAEQHMRCGHLPAPVPGRPLATTPSPRLAPRMKSSSCCAALTAGWLKCRLLEENVLAGRITHLSIANLFDGNHNHPDIPRFIEEFSSILYSGEGKRPQVLDKLSIGPEFPVRLLVGIPTKVLTREQRLIAESYCSMIFGRNLGDNQGMWSYGKGWRPQNAGRTAASIRDSTLDTDFMFALGISKSVWGNDILFAPSAFNGQNKRLPNTMLRYLFSMVAFGFSDPQQFFTAADPLEP